MNRVELTGKVSKAGMLKYTPSGTPICEFTLAAPQAQFGQKTMGHFEVVVMGESAEEKASLIRIGRVMTVAGTLWTRTYKDRAGRRQTETKVLADFIEEEKK